MRVRLHLGKENMSAFKDTMTWFKGLMAAVVSAAANSITVAIVEPETFNFNEGFESLWKVAAVSALVGAALYLKQSPVPKTLPE